MATMEITGLTRITGARDQNRVRGRLTLPKEADDRLFAFKWEKKGVNLQRAMDEQEVLGTEYRVKGWQVWKSGSGQPHSRALSSGIYVLMFRPKQLQQAVQVLYSNVSRERTINEATGRTVAGNRNEDRGVLVDTVLNAVERGDSNEELVDGLRLNRLPTNVDNPAQATVSGRATTKKSK